MSLPPQLEAGIEQALRAVPRSALATATAALSRRYRDTQPMPPFIRSEIEALAYLVYRLPGTFAAVSAALGYAFRALPDWQPYSLLDIGSGPGTVAWSALDVWPTIGRIELVEEDSRMIALGSTLASRAESDALVRALWTQGDATLLPTLQPADVVVASYLIGEVPSDRRAELVQQMWEAARGMLVLVQAGTPAGFEVLRAARSELLSLGAHIAAPCPHDGPCPMSDGDWCHFSARLSRSRLHRELKQGDLGYEDEKFSYVAVVKHPLAGRGNRVVRHPFIRPGQVHFQLCTPDGLAQELVTRREGPRFQVARHTRWGDVLPPRP